MRVEITESMMVATWNDGVSDVELYCLRGEASMMTARRKENGRVSNYRKLKDADRFGSLPLIEEDDMRIYAEHFRNSLEGVRVAA